MEQRFDQGEARCGGITSMLAPRVARCAQRASRLGWSLRKASWAEIEPWLAKARQEMSLAADQAIRAVLAVHPSAVRILTDAAGRQQGFFCYLPLNDDGASAIVAGRLNGLAPDPRLLCGEGDAPTAIYLWLTYAPSKLGRAVGPIMGCLDAIAPEGCPVFSRAINPHAERLNSAIGLLPASEIYPGAPAWLLVALPEASMSRPTPKRRIEVRCVRNLDDLMKVFVVRSATYLTEQLCLYEEEFDGNDLCGTQLLGLVDGDAAGCARIRYFGDFAKLERVAVRREYRNSRLAHALARAAVDHCRAKGFTKVYGHARADLERFWRVFGFRPIEGRGIFTFADVRYREMIAEFIPIDDAIRYGHDPLVAIRPEGAWNEPGPLELPSSPERASSIRIQQRGPNRRQQRVPEV